MPDVIGALIEDEVVLLSSCINAGGCVSGLLSPILTSFLVLGSIILIALDCRLLCVEGGRDACGIDILYAVVLVGGT